MADTARIKANVGTMIDKGATEQEIDTYLQSEGVNAQALRGAPELPKAPPPGALDTISTLAGETLDGVIPNAGRTMRGVGGAIGNTIAAAIGRDSFRPVDAFHDEERQYDADKAQVDEGHPNLSSAAGWAGFAGSFGLPVARIGRGASLAARLGKGAANGAIYGAASGALNETGDGRLANAALGAAGGAAMGAAAYPAMNAAHSVFNTARRNIPGIDAGAHFLEDAYSRLRGRGPVNPAGAANAQAERMLADQMDGSRFLNQGMGTGNVPSTVDNVGAEVARRQGLGVPAMPADVSEDLRQTTAWALQGRGTMATRARQVLAGRQAQSGTRIRGHVTETMGPAVDPIAEVQRINQRASAASEPGYRAAYAQPMLVTPEIAQIMRTPAFRNAIPQAFENIRNGMGDPTRLGFRILAPGHGNRLPPDLPHFQASDGSTVVVDPNQLSFEAFDQISRQMRDSGQAAMNNAGFRPRDTTNSVHINARTRDLRRHLADQNEPFRDVTANYADEMAIREALEAGQEVGKLSAPEISAQFRDMPEHAREAWMSGARTAVADTATQKGLKPTANVAQQVRQQVGLSGAGGYAAEGDRAKQAAIEVMAGQPGMMNRLDDRLEGEDQAFKTFAEASLGSKTQPRQAVDEALSGEALTVARHVATGNIAGAVSSVLLRGNPRGTLRFKRDVQDRIAEIMTATRPADVSALLRAVADRAAQDDRFGAALARAGVTPAKIAALQAAGQDGDPVPLELDDGQVLLGFENNETTGHQDAPVYGKFGTHYPSSH